MTEPIRSNKSLTASLGLAVTIFVTLVACTHKSVKPSETVAETSSVSESLALDEDMSTPEPSANSYETDGLSSLADSSYSAPVAKKRISKKKSKKQKAFKKKKNKRKIVKLKRKNQISQIESKSIEPKFDEQALITAAGSVSDQMTLPPPPPTGALSELASPDDQFEQTEESGSTPYAIAGGLLLLGLGLVIFRKRSSSKKKSRRLVFST